MVGKGYGTFKEIEYWETENIIKALLYENFMDEYQEEYLRSDNDSR